MINNSLVKLLKSLNKEELQLFEDFLNSPFFNKKTTVVNLFNYLKNFHPNFNDTEKLSRKNIYHIMYPDKKYNYGVMKNIIYELDLLGEKFLGLIGYSKNKLSQFKYRLTELTDRNLSNSFKKNLKKAELLLERETRDEAYFRNKMDIEVLKLSFHIMNISRTEKPDFEFRANNYLISFFLTKFFKINYNNLVTRDNFGIFEEIEFLDEVLNYIRKTPGIDPAILFYYYKFMLIYTENETVYHEFKKLLREQAKNLGRKEQFNIYNSLMNYCYGRIASGEWRYYKELFKIYNEMIANKIITAAENDYFDTVHFRLAAETGTRLKKFEWVKRFIEQYSDKLRPKFKTNEINIAYANYYFSKKNYDEAQRYLSQTHVYTAYDKVYTYILQSMIYYERKQFETLISEVDAIRHFIANDKNLWIESRNSFHKYVKYLNELVKLNIKEQENINASVNKLKKSLIPEVGILEKGWLLEKLKEMSSNN